jgi:hypothetical protein
LKLGQHETLDSAPEGSFLDRERAMLGEDAEQFGVVQDRTNNATTVEDHDEDLLGGDDFGEDNRAATVGDDVNEFESSFPAIDTQNEVSTHFLTPQASAVSEALAA